MYKFYMNKDFMEKYFSYGFIKTEKVICLKYDNILEFSDMEINYYDAISGKMRLVKNSDVEDKSHAVFINSDTLIITLQDEESALYFNLKFGDYVKEIKN